MKPRKVEHFFLSVLYHPVETPLSVPVWLFPLSGFNLAAGKVRSSLLYTGKLRGSRSQLSKHTFRSSTWIPGGLYI